MVLGSNPRQITVSEEIKPETCWLHSPRTDFYIRRNKEYD
jgi:hypothetical protein